YVCGKFNDVATFGVETFTALNTQDGFISKINFCMESTTYYADNDNDGYGDAADVLEGCSPIAGYVLNSNDCDDANGDVYPDATEICNLLDDNCDGLIDESIINTTLTISGPTTFCKGSNVTLNAEVVVGYSYQWKKNGAPIPGAFSNSYSATKSGNYQVTISTAEGCSATSATIPVTVFNTPNATINNLDGTNNLCVDASIKLKANAGAGYTYQWIKNGVDIAGATTQIYFANAIGNYRVRVTNADGCPKNSAVLSIINACKSSDAIESKDFSITPNPNNGRFTLIFSNEFMKESSIPLIIYDMVGNQVFATNIITSELAANNEIILPTNLSSGLYLVTLNLESGVIHQKVEIIK
ncbi:MAG: MopE-related protein, partial [Chitinophagales bacterium]